MNGPLSELSKAEFWFPWSEKNKKKNIKNHVKTGF